MTTTYVKYPSASSSPGVGNVVGPASSTDNAVARFDGTTGKLLQNSVVTIDDAGVMAGASISASANTLTNIANASISASAAIDFSKLATLSSTNILVGSAGNVATSTAVTGDVLISNTGVTAINTGVIINTDVNASAAIAYSKLAALPSANVLVGSAGNVATAVAITGDIAVDNAGVTAISTGVIVNADINASAAIAYSKLNLATSIVNGDVSASAAIAGTKIAPDFGSQNITTTGTLTNGSTSSFGGGAVSTSAINAIQPSAAQNPLAGTTQRAYRAGMISTASVATARISGYSSAVTTATAAGTTAIRSHFDAAAQPKGAGSTITRDVNFLGPQPTDGANNACFADNETFTGNSFLNQTGTVDNVLGGEVKIGTAGKAFSIKEGANARMGVSTLVAGTVVVSTTAVTATSRIFLTAQSLGTVTIGQGLAVSARSAGTSFTILSASAIDTSVVAWMIIEPL